MNNRIKQQVSSGLDQKLKVLITKYGSKEAIPAFEIDALYQELVLLVKTRKETEFMKEAKKFQQIPTIKFQKDQSW